jgi:hypothetical protein
LTLTSLKLHERGRSNPGFPQTAASRREISNRYLFWLRIPSPQNPSPQDFSAQNPPIQASSAQDPSPQALSPQVLFWTARFVLELPIRVAPGLTELLSTIIFGARLGDAGKTA